MKIYDITIPISEQVPIYEGDPEVRIEVAASIRRGDPVNVTQLCFGAHTATHIDAPNHFIEGTKRIHELELEKFIGPCRVVEIAAEAKAITERDIEDLDRVERVLFKTRNSAFWDEPAHGFRTDFTYLTPEAARALAEKKIKLVGIDYLSVERFGSTDFATHKILLGEEIVIVEGLDLRRVPPGDYELLCLPLKVISETGDGAPARAVLRSLI